MLNPATKELFKNSMALHNPTILIFRYIYKDEKELDNKVASKKQLDLFTGKEIIDVPPYFTGGFTMQDDFYPNIMAFFNDLKINQNTPYPDRMNKSEGAHSHFPGF